MNDTEGDERLGRARLVGMRTWAALGCCGLIGVALGAAIGLAGVSALMGTQAGSGLNLQLPWPALIGILLASAAVGVLASLRPAGRAAAIAPVAALATD